MKMYVANLFQARFMVASSDALAFAVARLNDDDKGYTLIGWAVDRDSALALASIHPRAMLAVAIEA